LTSPKNRHGASGSASGASWASIANGNKGGEKQNEGVVIAVASASGGSSSGVVAGVPKKQRACPLWGRKGRCRFGDRCKYLHDPESKGVKVLKKNAKCFE
jgi:hypothetical protein